MSAARKRLPTRNATFTYHAKSHAITLSLLCLKDNMRKPKKLCFAIVYHAVMDGSTA